MTVSCGALGTLAIVMGVASPALGAPPPVWLRTAAATAGPPESAALVLLDEVNAAVTTDGKLRTTRRYAVRLRDRDGRDAASIRQVYVTDSGKIRGMRGWLIRASGDTRELGAANTTDLAIVDNDVFNDVRIRVLSAAEEIAAGDVFGVEVDSEERLLFAQIEWALQGRWPVRLSRRTLALPQGWTAKSLTFNRAPLEPHSENGLLIWEAKDLVEVPIEDLMPPASDLIPRLAISLFGSAGSPAPGQFATWPEVAAWLESLGPQAAKPGDAVARKANELVASATSERERIGAIARFVQRVQYVSIQTGLGRGGGYVPRPAEAVLQRNYGDCKDKANLMRMMLAAIGIPSFMVSVFSSDRNYVRSEWPSPQQFNHAIVAVRVSEDSAGASVLEHRTLGRLLIFDPTDPFTPPGELPADEEGSLALIEAGANSALMRLPIAPLSQHKLVRTAEGRLGPRGDLTLRISEDARGSEASIRRALFSSLDASGYRGMLQDRLGSVIPGARVLKVTPDTPPSASNFVVTTELSADGYAQSTGPLLLVKPPLEVGYRMRIPPGGGRRTPLVLAPRFVEETLTLEIPDGFAVDEIPQSISLETPFGRYALSYTSTGRRLTAERRLEVPLKSVPVTDYDAARAFFDRVRAADTAPVVLKR